MHMRATVPSSNISPRWPCSYDLERCAYGAESVRYEDSTASKDRRRADLRLRSERCITKSYGFVTQRTGIARYARKGDRGCPLSALSLLGYHWGSGQQ